MVAALNDSGFLIYLQPISKDNPGAKVVITIKQGEKRSFGVGGVGNIVTRACRGAGESAQTLLVFGAGSRAEKTKK